MTVYTPSQTSVFVAGTYAISSLLICNELRLGNAGEEMIARHSGAGDSCIIPGIHMRNIYVHYKAGFSPDRFQHRLGYLLLPLPSPNIFNRAWARAGGRT